MFLGSRSDAAVYFSINLTMPFLSITTIDLTGVPFSSSKTPYDLATPP